MMNKKIFSLVFSMVFAATSASCLTACKDSGGLDAFRNMPTNKQMMIGGWVSMNTLEDYRMAKEMGLTHIFIDEYFAPKGSQDYKDILGFCEEVGLKAIVNMGAERGQ